MRGECETADAAVSTKSVPDDYSDLSVIIPTVEEERTIGSVISSVHRFCHWAQVIVVDGKSPDDTKKTAQRAGADFVLSRSRDGYGNAIRAGLIMNNRPVVAMVDGDGTYDLSVLPRMVNSDRKGRVVVGCRFHSKPRAMPTVRYIGIRIFSLLLLVRGIKIKDSQSGLQSYPGSLSVHLTEGGMSFSTEVLLAGKKHGFRIEELITREYYPRPQGSSSMIRLYMDGLSILYFIFSRGFLGRQ